MSSVKEMKDLLLQCREKRDEKQIANIAYKLGDTYRERQDWDQALPLLEEALELCRKHENPTGEAIVALSLAALHLERKDLDQAERLARSSFEFYRGQEDSRGRVKACMILGDTCWSRDEFEAAIAYYEEALETCRAHQDVMGSASLLDRIAKMHRLVNQENKALACFQESLDCWQRLSIPDRVAMTRANMGDIFKGRGDLSQAILHHEQALSLYRQLRNTRAITSLEKELQALRGMQGGRARERKNKKEEAD